MSKCMSLHYLVLKNGITCRCAFKFGMYGRVNDNICNVRCPGEASEMCGGPTYNSIYGGIQYSHPHLSLPVQEAFKWDKACTMPHQVPPRNMVGWHCTTDASLFVTSVTYKLHSPAWIKVRVMWIYNTVLLPYWYKLFGSLKHDIVYE